MVLGCQSHVLQKDLVATMARDFLNRFVCYSCEVHITDQ